MHIATLCITISLCATVALACLFSPKVYIILIHPEKNMRLAKQLKAQANSIRFASQLPTNASFMFPHHLINKDSVNNDERSTIVTSNNTEETDQPLMPNRKAASFKNSSNNYNHNDQQKIPTIITTSHSDSCLNNEKQRLAIKRYNCDDEDSLNSNVLQDEPIMQ